jgi:hypothetical protein
MRIDYSAKPPICKVALKSGMNHHFILDLNPTQLLISAQMQALLPGWVEPAYPATRR